MFDGTEEQRGKPDVVGIDDPKATMELARQLLPEGVRIPVDLLHTMATLLCNPVAYRKTQVGDIIAIADQVNAHLDRQFREAQQ